MQLEKHDRPANVRSIIAGPLWVAAFSLALLTACACEPPRVYNEPVFIHEGDAELPSQPTVLVTGAPIAAPPQSALLCSDLACDGDLTISGQMAASSFLEGAPIIVDAVANVVYDVPVNATTVLVYPNGSATTVVLPIAASAPGRIVRVKIMGAGLVDVHGASLDPSMNVTDMIDGAPSYGLQGLDGGPYPSVALQAYHDAFVPPNAPQRTGWAVVAVSP